MIREISPVPDVSEEWVRIYILCEPEFDAEIGLPGSEKSNRILNGVMPVAFCCCEYQDLRRHVGRSVESGEWGRSGYFRSIDLE